MWSISFLTYQPHLISLSIVITTSKYVHVSIQRASTGPGHGGRDFPCHVEHLPSEKEKNVARLLTFTYVMTHFLKQRTKTGQR